MAWWRKSYVCKRRAGPAAWSRRWAIGGVPYPFTIRVAPQVAEDLFEGIVQQLGQVGLKRALLLHAIRCRQRRRIPCHSPSDLAAAYTSACRCVIQCLYQSLALHLLYRPQHRTGQRGQDRRARATGVKVGHRRQGGPPYGMDAGRAYDGRVW